MMMITDHRFSGVGVGRGANRQQPPVRLEEDPKMRLFMRVHEAVKNSYLLITLHTWIRLNRACTHQGDFCILYTANV